MRRTPRSRRRTRPRVLATSCAVAVALLVAWIVSGAPADAPDGPPPRTQDAPGAADLDAAPGAEAGLRLLRRVRVVEARVEVPGYDRDCGPDDGCVFGTSWTDDSTAPGSRNGCDTRNDVLGASLRGVSFAPGTGGCRVVAGVLADPYTGEEIDVALRGSEIHVDHLVPLAAAWDLGAAGWTPAQRVAFANDISRELLAVSGSANLSKGDATPAQWLPPRRAAHCGYVTDYLRVLDHYDLALTRDDARVVRRVLQTRC